jgi:hypothetical protein
MAEQTATLRAAFAPERLGAPTTIYAGFRIRSIPVGSSMPLTNVSLFLPSEIGLATSGLGLENCLLSRLEELGAEGCPSDALMGRGEATAEIPIGRERILERALVEVFSGRVQDGRLTLLLYANEQSPFSGQVVFPATVVPAAAPYGEGINTVMPLVPTLPGAPDLAVTQFQIALGTTVSGPDHFVYYRSLSGRHVAYLPSGLLLPPTCPRGGFPFNAMFTFADGSSTSAHTTVRCPRLTTRHHLH